MALAIAPVTPLIGVSPISAFDNRNVLVPLQVINNKAVQDALQENGGNQSSNRDLFPFELNDFSEVPSIPGGDNNVVVPIQAQSPEIADQLEANGGNQLDNGTAPDETDPQNLNNTSTNSLFNNTSSTNRFERLNDDLQAIPFNDNIARVTAQDTQFPLETVVTLQEIPVTPAVVNFQGNVVQNPVNIYSYIINALQGGFNEASPENDNDHTRVEFEV